MRRDVGHDAERRDQQRAGDGVLAAVGAGVLVVQAVLAGDEGRAVGDGRVVAALRAAHQAAQPVGQVGVAPAEVVEQGDLVGVGADGHAVAHRLVDGGPGHGVGVERAVGRVDAGRERDPAVHAAGPVAAAVGSAAAKRQVQHRGVGTAPRRPRPDERLDHRAALHLVVVVADDVLLAADVGRREQGQQRGRQVACRERRRRRIGLGGQLARSRRP